MSNWQLHEEYFRKTWPGVTRFNTDLTLVAVTPQVIAAAVPGHKHRVIGAVFHQSVTTEVSLLSDVIEITTWGRQDEFQMAFNPVGWCETLTNDTLSIVSVIGTNVRGIIVYVTIPT